MNYLKPIIAGVVLTFLTAINCLNAQQTTFAVIGDFGNGSSDETAVANLVKSWSPQFIITTGDNRYGATNFDLTVGRDYCEFLANASSGSFCDGNGSVLNAFFPSTGNHEYTDGAGINEYLDYFDLPGAGIESSGTSGSELYYDFVQGPVHFFVVDSYDATVNGTLDAQKAWLQTTMEASTALWKIVYFHHPPYSSSDNHGSTISMRWPFAEWGADAVLNGHDHTYERISMDGISYFVNGLGGMSKYGFTVPIPESIIQYNAEYGAQRVVVDEFSISFSFINVNGVTIDEYTIFKGNPPDNNAPVFTSDPITTLAEAQVGIPYNATLAGAATDLDGDALFYSRVSGPAWLRITADGSLTGDPLNGDIGLNLFTIQVSDNKGGVTQAQLQVTVLAPPPPPPAGTLDIRITAPNDDVEERASDGFMYFTSTDIELGDDMAYNGEQAEGFLFRNIPVPQGAVIVNAYLEFETDVPGTETTLLQITAGAADNAADFSAAPYDLTGRPTTAATVAWDVPAWNTADEKHQSPDLSAVIQEIVSRPGWVHLNNMVFIISGTGNREAEAYEGEPTAAALLHLEYTTAINNNPPVFSEDPILLASATEDLVYGNTLAGLATDPDGDELDYSLLSGPAWLTITPGGDLSGTPGNQDVGINDWIVKVDDGLLGSARAALQITVVNTNDAPVFSSDPLVKPDALVDIAYTGIMAGDVVDEDGDNVMFSVTGGPSWLVVAEDGSFSGTPLVGDVGPNSWTLRADDGQGGAAVTTLQILVRDPANLVYCASGGSGDEEWISGVSLNGTTHTSASSGSVGYEDFTSLDLFNLDAGSTCNLTLEPGFSSKGKFEFWSVWIDFNTDGDFDDPGEQVFLSSKSRSSVTGTITLPDMPNLVTRMRVSMKRDAEPSACETFLQGEVEDYTVSIAAVVPQAPVADFTSDRTTVSPNDVVQFSDLSALGPDSWTWSFPGGNPSVSAEQNPQVTYSALGSYDVSLTVSNAQGSDTKTMTGYIIVSEPSADYCLSASLSTSFEWIESLTISGTENRSGAGSGYSDFSNITVTLTPGSDAGVLLEPGFGKRAQREFWRIWIDFNNDSDFEDAGEEVFAMDNAKSSVTGIISVPSSASGSTKMRVSMGQGSAPLPCGELNRGEVEDYTVSFTAGGGLKNLALNAENQIEALDELSLQVYPNPATERLFVKVKGWEGSVTVYLYDMTGRAVFAGSEMNENSEINVSGLQKGIYLLEVRRGMTRMSKTIIIQ